MFLDVEPHLEREGIGCQAGKRGAASRRADATHVIGADQRADRLQGAEGVVLAVALAAAGVPDQVAALLVGQHVGRRPLKDDVQTLVADGERNPLQEQLAEQLK